jgi:hypothetical protein
MDVTTHFQLLDCDSRFVWGEAPRASKVFLSNIDVLGTEWAAPRSMISIGSEYESNRAICNQLQMEYTFNPFRHPFSLLTHSL